jgi:hypothetical protein
MTLESIPAFRFFGEINTVGRIFCINGLLPGSINFFCPDGLYQDNDQYVKLFIYKNMLGHC